MSNRALGYSDGGLELITSKRLPVLHGFPTRADAPAYGAGASEIEATLVALAAAARVDRARLFGVKQVHGGQVVEAPATELIEADAIWSGRTGDAVGVRTADCVPLLLVDPKGKRVAAVHAGWRGALAEIARVAIRALVTAGSRPEDLHAALGPSIRSCCYQVGDDLARQFRAHFGPGIAVDRDGHPWLDLPAAVRATLGSCGVPVEQTDDLGLCTACDDRFFSHRRDRGLTGRHFSFVACHF